MRGFSLVELSIVLVILGLLTGGILAGQSLIRAAELRAVTTEFQRYAAAANTFRDKYFAVPGDFRDATRFWNRQTAAADCVSNHGLGAAGSPGACDGNGSGRFDAAGAASESAESFQFWRHLQLAGLIEGTYSGHAGSGSASHSTNLNTPKSKLGTAYWLAGFAASLSGHTGIFNRGDIGFLLQLGGLHASGGNRLPVLRPEEAWNIDTKMDDGRPARGSVRARVNEDTQTLADCTTAATSADLDANYLLTSTTITCALGIAPAF